AELQTQLLKDYVFHDFFELWPHKFNNKTNGVTPRRFIKMANPLLSDLISAKIGAGWLEDLEQLRKLEKYADDADFQQQWRAVKHANKTRLAAHIQKRLNLQVDPDSIFDV